MADQYTIEVHVDEYGIATIRGAGKSTGRKLEPGDELSSSPVLCQSEPTRIEQQEAEFEVRVYRRK
jgi:hypothetical protein